MRINTQNTFVKNKMYSLSDTHLPRGKLVSSSKRMRGGPPNLSFYVVLETLSVTTMFGGCR